MRILFNASTIVSGGGIQVSINFIIASISDLSNTFYYCLSRKVYDSLDDELKKKIINLAIFDKSPANLFYRSICQSKFNEIDNKFKPDMSLTIFGPAYVNLKCKSLVGFADPWATHSNKYAFSKLSLIKRVHRILLTQYKLYYLDSFNYLWVETDFVNTLLSKKLKNKIIYTIPNTVNPIFYSEKKKIQEVNNEVKRVFILSADYPHKNIDIIIDIIKELKIRKIYNIRFILTLPEDSKTYSLIKKSLLKEDCQGYIENKGVLSADQCFDEYNKCDLVFLPSLLENFSAVYIESNLMRRPLLVADFEFVRNICHDSCLYFEPLNHLDALSKINTLLFDQKKRDFILMNSLKISFESHENKYNKMINILKNIYES
jgi:hypothetical protein